MASTNSPTSQTLFVNQSERFAAGRTFNALSSPSGGRGNTFSVVFCNCSACLRSPTVASRIFLRILWELLREAHSLTIGKVDNPVNGRKQRGHHEERCNRAG